MRRVCEHTKPEGLELPLLYIYPAVFFSSRDTTIFQDTKELPREASVVRA